MDVADALHLALCDKAARFLTFDDALARRASKLGANPPISAP
jgi:predicted nucleic acid-binding protein